MEKSKSNIPATTSESIPKPQHPSLLESSSSTASSTTSVTANKIGHVRRPNWTTAEDEQLCRSWLKNSFDPVTNAIQKGTQFWHRVADDFASCGAGNIARNKDHVRNRWQLLQPKVIKFTSCYERIQSLLAAEKTHDEIVAEALRSYEREESHKFTFYSSWVILRNSNWWLQWSSNAGQKRATSSSFQPSCDIPVSPHSTVSLLDSDGSPTIDQPLNRNTSSGLGMVAGGFNVHDTHIANLANGVKTEKPIGIPGHQNTANTQYPPSSSSAYLSSNHHHHHPRRHYRHSNKYRIGDHEDQNVDRSMAMAIKRKADVQEATLEVQLLAIDPDQITDPLRKEVYTMKMEEIRDRYRAKRSKSTAEVNDRNHVFHISHNFRNHRPSSKCNDNLLAADDNLDAHVTDRDLNEFNLSRAVVENDLSVPF